MTSEKEVDHVSVSIDAKLKGLPPISTKHCIFKVHDQLRKLNETAYEPKLLAVGPYHRAKLGLQAMEEHKLRYLQELLKRRNESSVGSYVATLRELEGRARECYSESIRLSSDQFVEMLLLDGCFIVELFRKCAQEESRDENDPVFKMDWIGYGLLNDLMLFENQLPFFVLDKLFEMTKGPKKGSSLVKLALHFFAYKIPNLGSIQDLGQISVPEVQHLLGLIHRGLVPSFVKEGALRNFATRNENWEFIGSATELMKAGIKLKKKGGNMFEIKFKHGILELPPLLVEDQTESVYRNLIAYEQYHQEDHVNYVTDYIVFMNYLMKSRIDVELLRLRGLLVNWLGDDGDISSMFNKLASNVIISGNLSDFFYAGILSNMNKHCHSWRGRMAKLGHNHCRRPAALFSFFAVVFLLLLLASVLTTYSILSCANSRF